MVTLTLTISIILFALYYAYQGKPVTIEAKNYKLKGRLYGKVDKMTKGSAVLFISGWNPTRRSLTTSNFYAGFNMKKQNTICLTISLRGMGSEGDINKLCRSDFLEDVIAAYDYMANIEGVDKENIRVVGECFGGYLACLLSSKRPVKKMALRVPTDFPNIGFADIPQIRITGNLSKEWKSQKHAFTDSFALSAINAFTGNLMMIASEKDNLVPFQTTENYLDAVKDSSKLEYLFMKQASHGMFHPKLQWDYNRILSKWLRI